MSDVRYFNIAIPAATRLELMRKDFADHAKKYPCCPEYAKPKTWRDVRRYGLHNWMPAFCAGLNAGFNDGEPIYYTHAAQYFQGERFADECDSVNINRRGWYSDTGYNSKVRGIVVKLTRDKWLAGYYWSNNGERVYWAVLHESERDAALMADEHARVYAESCFEDSQKYDAAWQLQRSIEEKGEELEKAYAVRNNPRFNTRDECGELVADIRKMRARLADEFSDYL